MEEGVESGRVPENHQIKKGVGDAKTKALDELT